MKKLGNVVFIAGALMTAFSEMRLIYTTPATTLENLTRGLIGITTGILIMLLGINFRVSK